MKRYHVEVEVQTVAGTQTFEIDAETPLEALEGVLAGQGEIVDDDLRVVSYVTPTLDDVVLVDAG